MLLWITYFRLGEKNEMKAIKYVCEFCDGKHCEIVITTENDEEDILPSTCPLNGMLNNYWEEDDTWY